MPAVHTIRLRGPWGCQPLARFEQDEAGRPIETTSDLRPAGRLTMPCDWSAICGAEFQGRVRFRRRFHWPTRLTPRERVWLVFEGVSGAAVAELNEERLGEFSGRGGPAEFDVTGRLAPTNVLIVDVTWPGPLGELSAPSGGPGFDAGGGLTGEVRLEVRLVR